MAILEDNRNKGPEDQIGGVHRYHHKHLVHVDLAEWVDQGYCPGDAQHCYQEHRQEGDDSPEDAPCVTEDCVTKPHGLSVVKVTDSYGQASGAGKYVNNYYQNIEDGWKVFSVALKVQ